jgi:hypothetical protein
VLHVRKAKNVTAVNNVATCRASGREFGAVHEDENRGWLTAIPGLPRPGKIYLGVMKRVELRMQSGEQQNTRWRWTEFSLVIVK